MTSSDAVAAYAAVVATAALVWQIFIWRAGRRNRVIVDLVMGFGRMDARTLGPAVNVIVRNLGTDAIRPIAVGLQVTLEGGRRQVIYLSDGDLLRQKVPGNDSGIASILREDLEEKGVDFGRPMLAWVDLATGETVKSPLHSLVARPLDEKGDFLPRRL